MNLDLLSMGVPAWAVLIVLFLAVALPPTIKWARGHNHPEIADELEIANNVIAFLTHSITTADHSGSVAAHVEANAEKHGLDEHPAVAKITS